MTIKEQLFQHIRSKLPSHATLEQEIARVLGIELSEAFILVKSDQTLQLKDAIMLSNRFNVVLNQLQPETHQPNVLPFQFFGFDYNIKTLEEYFLVVLNQFQRGDMFGHRKMVYVASELPLFSIFQFPELAAFKLFFWGRTVYRLPSFQKQRFRLSSFSEALLEIGEAAWNEYLNVPSTEIWSSNIINDILTQIYYFWKHQIFQNKYEAILICDRLVQMLDHIEMQARIGKKFHPQQKLPQTPNFELYYNDVAVSNNTILVNTPTRKQVFISQNALNYLTSDNEMFYLHTERWVHQLRQNSIQISLKNDKLRSNFFIQMKNNIEFIKQEILAGR